MKHQKQEGIVQKGALSKAAGALARGAYGLVREHDKGPRTPLTPFFNIPSGKSFETLYGQFRFRRSAKIFDQFAPVGFGLVRMPGFHHNLPQFK